MRMSELSEQSGVAIATIKFYQREDLLHAGEFSSPTQASYDESHVERLRLVRALIDVGGLPVAGARAVLAAIDNTAMPLDWAFGVAQRAIPGVIPPAEPAADGSGADTRGATELARALENEGIHVHSNNPGLPVAARVLDSFVVLGHDELLGLVPPYLRAARIVAEADLDAVGRRQGRADMAETVVVGTVLGDSLFAGLRRIAQENLSHERFPAPETTTEGDCA
jgi:DNA-binding transcriptional MerR regulator